MSGWQDIGSAPRDGTCILAHGVWAGEINGPDRNDDPHTYIAYFVKGSRPDFAGFDWHVLGTDASAAWVAPTHWMPLPDAPTTPSTEGQGA